MPHPRYQCHISVNGVDITVNTKHPAIYPYEILELAKEKNVLPDNAKNYLLKNVTTKKIYDCLDLIHLLQGDCSFVTIPQQS